MIAKKDEYLHEASEALYTMNADEMVRQQCQARADYYRLQNTISRRMEELTAERNALVSENRQLANEIDALRRLLEENGISHP